MNNFIKKILFFVPDFIIRFLLISKYGYENIYHSQFGEDIIIKNIFQKNYNGFYVDIGAHHPKRFSNTYLLYQKGWSGINIDPIPGMKKLFKKRRRDININAGISHEAGEIKYFMFQKGAVNTFEEGVALKQEAKFGKPQIINVQVFTLKEVLDKYASGSKIDFMNIDVEGHELEVLNSNDWEKYSPKIIAIEDQELDISNPSQSKTYKFLRETGYTLFNKLNYTAFYKKI